MANKNVNGFGVYFPICIQFIRIILIKHCSNGFLFLLSHLINTQGDRVHLHRLQNWLASLMFSFRQSPIIICGSYKYRTTRQSERERGREKYGNNLDIMVSSNKSIELITSLNHHLAAHGKHSLNPLWEHIIYATYITNLIIICGDDEIICISINEPTQSNFVFLRFFCLSTAFGLNARRAIMKIFASPRLSERTALIGLHVR